jgi:L-threonylcarbamoyladenylate synthase
VDPIGDAVAAALRGELIVFPTDTVYGIATVPDDPDATTRLFDAKRRPGDLTLPVLVATVELARALARFDERAERLAEALWPGALTLVLPREGASRSWRLGGHAATIGLRVPRHPMAFSILSAAGPLATTSANRSGEAPAPTCDELHAAFGELVSVYLCQDEALVGRASTVVDLTQADVRLLRGDPEDANRVSDLLGAEASLLDSRPPG